MSSQLVTNPLVLVYKRAKQRQKLQNSSQYKNSIKNVNLNDQIKFRGKIIDTAKNLNYNKFLTSRNETINNITILPDPTLKKYRTRKNTSSISNNYNTLILRTWRNDLQSKSSSRYSSIQENEKAQQMNKIQNCLLQPCQISTIVLEERPFSRKNQLFPKKIHSSFRKTQRIIHTVDFRLRVRKPEYILESKSRQIIEPWKYQNQEDISN